MPISPESFTGDDKLDRLVLSFYIIRIFIHFLLMVMCIPQLIYDIFYFYQRKKKPNARFYVLIALVLFPIFRILYCGFFIETHQYDFGENKVLYSSMWTTFFQFQIWTFVQCFWIQLLYTFFISETIRLENHERCWKYTWGLWTVCFVYTVAYSILAIFASEKVKSVYYTVGFIFLVAWGGATTFINGMVLIRQMNKHEAQTLKEDTNVIIGGMVKKVKYLSGVLLFCMLIMLGRTIVFYSLKIPKDSNLKHLSSFITFVTETLTAITVMIAIADKPVNYWWGAPVMTVRNSAKNSTRNSSFPSYVNNSKNKSSAMSIELTEVDEVGYEVATTDAAKTTTIEVSDSNEYNESEDKEKNIILEP